MTDVTVYWRPMCGYCETLKDALATRGVVFRGVNIWEQREQAEVVKGANNGDELVPTVRVGTTFMANPSVDDVLEAVAAA